MSTNREKKGVQEKNAVSELVPADSPSAVGSPLLPPFSLTSKGTQKAKNDGVAYAGAASQYDTQHTQHTETLAEALCSPHKNCAAVTA